MTWFYSRSIGPYSILTAFKDEAMISYLLIFDVPGAKRLGCQKLLHRNEPLFKGVEHRCDPITAS